MTTDEIKDKNRGELEEQSECEQNLNIVLSIPR